MSRSTGRSPYDASSEWVASVELQSGQPQIVSCFVIDPLLELTAVDSDVDQVADAAWGKLGDDPKVGPTALLVLIVGPHVDARVFHRKRTKHSRLLNHVHLSVRSPCDHPIPTPLLSTMLRWAATRQFWNYSLDRTNATRKPRTLYRYVGLNLPRIDD